MITASYLKSDIEPLTGIACELYRFSGTDESQGVTFIEPVCIARVTPSWDREAPAEYVHPETGLIDGNNPLKKALETAVTLVSNYTHCPNCARLNRSIKTKLVACPRCGKIYKVKDE